MAETPPVRDPVNPALNNKREAIAKKSEAAYSSGFYLPHQKTRNERLNATQNQFSRNFSRVTVEFGDSGESQIMVGEEQNMVSFCGDAFDIKRRDENLIPMNLTKPRGTRAVSGKIDQNL